MLIHAKHITHVGIHNLDRFMRLAKAPAKLFIPAVYEQQRNVSQVWWRIGSNIIRVCVQCVSQWKMRAQCRITAITWVVNLIQSIHAKCFVNTHHGVCVFFSPIAFFFFFHSMNSNICRTNSNFTFFRFAVVQPFIFTPNRAGHKVNMKLQRNETLAWMFISAWNRHCAHKGARRFLVCTWQFLCYCCHLCCVFLCRTVYTYTQWQRSKRIYVTIRDVKHRVDKNWDISQQIKWFRKMNSRSLSIYLGCRCAQWTCGFYAFAGVDLLIQRFKHLKLNQHTSA